MIEQGLVALLSANTALMALIDPHIYPVFVPETATYPCLSYQNITRGQEYTFDGKSFCSGRFQFDAWSKSYGEAKAVQKALRNALDAFHGSLTDGTKVMGTFRSMETDFYEADSALYRALSEYTFEFIEP